MIWLICPTDLSRKKNRCKLNAKKCAKVGRTHRIPIKNATLLLLYNFECPPLHDDIICLEYFSKISLSYQTTRFWSTTRAPSHCPVPSSRATFWRRANPSFRAFTRSLCKRTRPSRESSTTISNIWRRRDCTTKWNSTISPSRKVRKNYVPKKQLLCHLHPIFQEIQSKGVDIPICTQLMDQGITQPSLCKEKVK